ncbi:hypothetical protein CASFOL_014348 [Castilleja foliolosa]|uniref:Replication factor A C-terminal domain-containing protein n=1 Tax=Castilleja foliolosa TaxID=1961234 RepID=A0ABD3DN76_9LAMI
MDMHPSFIQEFCQIYSEISSRKAVVRSISTLRELREDAPYWVEGTITGVERNKEFCFLACRICGKKTEEVAAKRWCFHCQEFTFTNIYRYNIEIVVADESDSVKMYLWNRASEKLIGEPAEDVISLYGDTARVMPDDIASKILGREGLFEVIVTSKELPVDNFNVSRLTIDDEIKDVYIVRNYPEPYESDTSDDSFLQTLNYIEEKDRAVNRGETKDIEAEADSETTHAKKKQKTDKLDN